MKYQTLIDNSNKVIYQKDNLTIISERILYSLTSSIEFDVLIDGKLVYQLEMSDDDLAEYDEYDEAECNLIKDLLANTVLALSEEYPY